MPTCTHRYRSYAHEQSIDKPCRNLNPYLTKHSWIQLVLTHWGWFCQTGKSPDLLPCSDRREGILNGHGVRLPHVSHTLLKSSVSYVVFVMFSILVWLCCQQTPALFVNKGLDLGGICHWWLSSLHLALGNHSFKTCVVYFSIPKAIRIFAEASFKPLFRWGWTTQSHVLELKNTLCNQ